LTSRARHLPTAALLAAASVLFGCSLFEPTFDDYVDTGDSAGRKKTPVKIELEMVFSQPKETPNWTGSGVTKAPGGAGDLHFTGVSKQFSTEQDARMDAVRDAREQIAAYVVTDVKKQVQRVTVASGRSSEILDPGTVQEEIARLLSATTLVGTASSEYYIQQWMRREDGVESFYWKAYSLVVFPEKQNRDIRAAVLRSSAQKRVDQLEMLSNSRMRARVRNFDERLRAVQQSMKDGRHVDAISQSQDLLDRLMPAEASDRKTDQPATRPTPKQVPPSEAWQAARSRNRGASGPEQAHVRSGLHATHSALKALSRDRLVQARKLLVDARSQASTAATKYKSEELRYQARLFDEFLKASVENTSASVKTDHRKSLQGLLQSYWRAAAVDNRCPACAVVHKVR